MDKSAIVNALMPFSEQKPLTPWSDYSVCGFTAEDATTLVDVVADPELLDAQDERAWIPLHAWRALLPLMPAGFPELLNVLYLLSEDDWASNDLPIVLSAAGEVAIEPLHAYILDVTNDQFARTIAIDALTAMDKGNPDLWEQLVAVLVDCLQMGTQDDLWVNAFLVSSLMDLKAVDAIDGIREAYAADKLDWSVCGDLEDVELELGLREERDTPKPNYRHWDGGMRPVPPSLEPVTLKLSGRERMERIRQFLAYYGYQEAVGSVTELHGFFTALGCSPEPVSPSEWMPALWGGEHLAPKWPDIESVQVFMDLIMPFYNAVMGGLMNVNTLTIPFDQYTVDGVSFTAYSGWCRGFEMGVGVGRFPTADIPGAGRFLDVIHSTQDYMTGSSIGLSPEERKEREKALTLAVRAICTLGRGGAVAGMPTTRTEAKVGRNDPCPCGSGKKYKKCCLH